METCNPFKVGDKVKLLKSSYDFNPILWRKYDGYRYSIVTGLFDGQISTTEDIRPQHYSHFELYEEEKDMTQQTTPQTQPKTKRVPFTHDLWEKYKDAAKIIYIPSGGEVLGFAYFPQADSRFRYAYLTRTGTVPTFGSAESFYLEIPITTKRIPFNPELKDTKVYYKGKELIEWVCMKTGWVCGTYISNTTTKENTNLFHQVELEMEIEEDV